MPKKSSSRVAAPKTSSSAAFSASSLVSNHGTSSILKSAFAPTDFQLSLFASTIRSLESEQLRIHDTITGELKATYTTTGTTINCIRWGSIDHRGLGGSSKKKRRKLNDGEKSDAASGFTVIAVGTGQSDIGLFSPLEGILTSTLEDAHEKGTTDFAFVNSSEAWSLGADGGLIQWNLRSCEKIRSLEALARSITTLAPLSSSLLLASQSTYIYDPASQESKTIPCFDQPIHTLIPQPSSSKSPSTHFIAAADSKSTIGVYDINTLSIVGNLNAGDEVRKAMLFSSGKASILTSISKAGDVELFESPFLNWSSSDNDTKSKRKKTTRRSVATVEIRRHDKQTQIVRVLDAMVDSEGILVLALAEDSVNLGFERISVVNEDGTVTISGVETITRVKSSKLVKESMVGAKDLRHAHVDESRTIVVQGEVDNNELLSDDKEDEDEDSQIESEIEDVTDVKPSTEVALVNGVNDVDEEMADAGEEEDPEDQPTFGEMIKARGINTVDVVGSQALASIAGGTGSLSSNLTLGTLLTQALNTNDSASLDTCLAQQDLQVIRATIERLDSALAVTLLHRLAERLHSRPGRAGSLLVWVQWTIVTHGGYLSSRPDTVKQLRSLHKVVQLRAQALQPLLALKGKLDMLDAQISFRKRLQENHMAGMGPNARPEDMIYIEGQPESDTDEDDEDEEVADADKDLDDDDEVNFEEDAEAIVADEEDDESENSDQATSSDSSEEDEMDGEVDHDDLDPEDSDTSDGDLSSLGGRQANGVKSR